jgi:hypothetical protein
MPNRYIKPLYEGFTDFNTLCEMGRKIPGSLRSDFTLPLSGWRRENRIDESRFHEIFDPFYN